MSENKSTISPRVTEEHSGTRWPILNPSSRLPSAQIWVSRWLLHTPWLPPLYVTDAAASSVPGINEIRLSRLKTRPARGTRSINVSYIIDRFCDFRQNDVSTLKLKPILP